MSPMLRERLQAPPPSGGSGLPIAAGAVVLIVGVAIVALLARGRLWSPPAPAAEAPPVATPSRPAPAPSPTATIRVATDPPGAKVQGEGETMCESTPCDITYVGDGAGPGFEHLLVFLKADYKLERRLVSVTASPVTIKLTKAR